MFYRNRHYRGTVFQQRTVRQDIGQHRDIGSGDIFGLAVLVANMDNAAGGGLRYRAYRRVRHDAFGFYVPRPLTLAYPSHRFREDAQFNGVNLAVSTVHPARSDKISGFDITETPLLDLKIFASADSTTACARTG